MNLKQLTAFREVMLTGSVSEAARNLLRTQPAISAAVAGLEDDVGFKLFDRRGGRQHPVPEAHYLFEEAGAIIDRLSAAERTMKSIRDLDRGTVQMVSMPGPSAFLLPDLISKFVENREHVRFSLITRSSIQVQQLISVQQYDVGLADLGFAGFADSPLVDHEVLNLECVCAIPANDPLAERDVVTAADLDDQPMATLYAEHPNFARTTAAFEKMDAALSVRFQAQYFLPLLTFVERRLAYALVDPLSARSYDLYRTGDSAVVFRPFAPVIHLVASIMTPSHRPLSNLVQAFIGELRVELNRIRATYVPD